MTKHEIFDIWSPPGATWSRWVKPVLFAQLRGIAAEDVSFDLRPMEMHWAEPADQSTAIIVDLPGALSVSAGLSLATIGYRPAPLFNACPQPLTARALVDVRPILNAVAGSTPSLAALPLLENAPPAFLLDADRNHAAIARSPGVFDNRSISLPTDFPSANFLRSCGVARIVVLQQFFGDPKADLSHTLRRWQEAGLPIFIAAMDEPALQPTVITRPFNFRVLWYNLLATFGLKANPLGGFGGYLPMPSSGSAG